eukprot:jgi/Botrbrau1/10528/Bobra.7_1s0009.1
MAHLLAKFGEAALRPHLVGGSWHKPIISGRIAALLRKKELLAGRPWPYEKESTQKKPFGFKRFKGHKVDKLSAARKEEIAKNMEEMPAKIAAYRESMKLKPGSLIDRLLLTPKQRKLKQLRTPAR